MIRAVWKYLLVGVVFVVSMCGVIALSAQGNVSKDTVKSDTTSTPIPEQTQSAPEPEISGKEDVVYRTPSGTKYHLSRSCPSLSKSKTVEQVTIAEALSDGLDACSRCSGK